MAIRAVVFDLDYTLAVPERDRQTLLDEATAVAGVRSIDRQEYLDAHGADLASETRAPIFDALVEGGDPVELASAYRRAVEGALVPIEGAETLISDLRESYRVGLLTDGPTRAQWGKLETLGWTDSFDAVVVTGALPAGKPDPRAFEAILDALGVAPGETVLVGDHPEADVRGAAAVGMVAVQVLDGRHGRVPEADAAVDRDRLGEGLRDLLLRQASLFDGREDTDTGHSSRTDTRHYYTCGTGRCTCMSDETVHESRRTRSRRAIASYLRRVADALGRGKPVPADEEQTVTVDPPAESELEIELEQAEENVSLEIEMEWDGDEDDIDTDAAVSKATFERYEDSAGEWRWRLRHRNGNIIADGSEGYASRQKATQGLESVKANAPGAYVVDQSRDEEAPETGGSKATFEIFEDSAGEWRWRLVHDNGNIIADGGQGYSSKQKCKQGLESVRKNAAGAPVEDAD